MHRTKTEFKNSLQCELEVRFGNLDQIMEWCRDNCLHDWSVKEVMLSVDIKEKFSLWYEFSFQDEKDYIAFTIKFK